MIDAPVAAPAVMEMATPVAPAAADLSRLARAHAYALGFDLVGIAALGPADGLAQALEALAQAMDNAPEQADQGLDTAIDAVTESPANDAPAGPPDGVPAGPPEDLPGGRP